MNKYYFRRYIVILCLLITTGVSSAEETQIKEPKFYVNKTQIKQGEFLQVRISDTTKKPRLWFNSREFVMYEIEGEQLYRALVPVENMTKPGDYALLARVGDWEKRTPVKVVDNGKGISKIYLSDDKADLEPTQKELNRVSYGVGCRSDSKLWSGKFIYPSKAAKSSQFGVKRSYNNGPVDSYHKGLDFAGSMGSPVYAPADGKVSVVGLEKDGFVIHGNVVIIDHGQAVTSAYLHLNKVLVKEGDLVKKGQQIGEVGHTGMSTGPHLHWGVYSYGTSVEPEIFVREEVL